MKKKHVYLTIWWDMHPWNRLHRERGLKPPPWSHWIRRAPQVPERLYHAKRAARILNVPHVWFMEEWVKWYCAKPESASEEGAMLEKLGWPDKLQVVFT